MENREIRFKIQNQENGLNFMIRIVEPGQSYGRDLCLTNDTGKNLVEFYDTRYDFDKDTEGDVLGQFVTRYYLDTLFKDETPISQNGLNLDGGVQDWSLDSKAMQDFYANLGFIGYSKENPEFKPSDEEKVTVEYTQWFRNNQDDVEPTDRFITVPKYVALNLKLYLENEKSVSDIKIINDDHVSFKI